MRCFSPEQLEARAAAGGAFCVVLINIFRLIDRGDHDAVRVASVRPAAVDPLRQQTGEGEGGKR